ncbi:MAG: sulfatase [Planctomycetaceae bacterium]|nr:sulfatase [Planctomycetales bacterium]MCB9926338.1 sulfatase [Planctomycetaceae bacterium]
MPNLLKCFCREWPLHCFVGSLLVTLAVAPSLGDEKFLDRPNIVFCFADDWGRYASAYRRADEDQTPNAVVKTPSFDRIASEGALFTNAFVNAPSCTPCRSSLLSGQYFWRTGRGAILQGAVWDLKIPSYPLILKEHGYHIGHSHKVWSPGTPVDAPYGAKETSYDSAGRKFSGFSQFCSKNSDPEEAKKILYDEVRENFRAFIRDRGVDQPFCYWFGPTNCHRQWVKGSGKKLWGIDPEKLKGKLPPFLPDNEVVREDFADYLGEVQAFDAGVGVLLAELDRLGELDNTLVVVSGDHGAPGFPRGKCNLVDFGVHVSLAIRWGKKIPPGRTLDDFVCLPDLAPTFLEAAGVKPPEVMTGRSLIEVLTSEKSGLVDASRDSVVVGRERHVAAARTDNLPYPQRAIRTKDFLYIRNFKPDRWPMGTAPGFGAPAGPLPNFEHLENNTFGAFGDLDASPTKAWIIEHRDDPGMDKYFDFAFGRRPGEELYNLSNDPYQMQNVASDPGYESIRKSLSERLLAVLEQTGDPRVIGEGDTFEKPPFSGAVEATPRRKK